MVIGVASFYIVWGLPWWGLKALLLRKWVGMTKDEVRDAFSSRMDRPYDVAALTAKYSERRIRIAVDFRFRICGHRDRPLRDSKGCRVPRRKHVVCGGKSSVTAADRVRSAKNGFICGGSKTLS